jgi:Skp family chaperone for outer membrane proteins
MSDTAARAAIDVQSIIARIDRDLAESAKLREETRQFVNEAHRMEAERKKLEAEAAKLQRDRWLAPLVLLASVAGGLVVAVLNHVWK